MASPNLPARSLSKRLAAVVAALEFDPPSGPLTLDDIQERASLDRPAARNIAHRLAAAGWLRQVKHGWYEFVPGSAVFPSASAWPLLIGINQPHLVSGLTAAREHSLTPQLPSRHLLVLDSEHRVPRTIARSPEFRVVRLRPWRVFGFELLAKDGVDVPMATIERVVIDAIEHPDWFAGIGETARIIERGMPLADRRQLIGAAIQWRSYSVLSRLGWWGDHVLRDGWTRAERARLIKSGAARSPVALVPGLGRAGSLDPGWRVIVNASEQALRMERDVL